MSATIPSYMLMSDLLKATGYDCPQELQGKTFANSTRGSDIDVESGREVRYTENGEYTVEPSEGFEAMDSVKVTVDTPVVNIETGKSVNITANGAQTVNPSSGYAAMDSVEVNVAIPLQDEQLYQLQQASDTITPSQGFTAMKQVRVNARLQAKTVTTNGDVTPDTYYAGLSKVTVAVPTKLLAYKDANDKYYYQNSLDTFRHLYVDNKLANIHNSYSVSLNRAASGLPSNIKRIRKVGNFYFALGGPDRTKIYKSTDGKTFSAVTVAPSYNYEYADIVYFNGQYVLFSTWQYFTSSDGSTWSAAQDFSTELDGSIRAAVVNNAGTKIFLASYESSEEEGYIHSMSTLGTMQKLITNSLDYSDIARIGTTILAISDTGGYISTDDGETWVSSAAEGRSKIYIDTTNQCFVCTQTTRIQCIDTQGVIHNSNAFGDYYYNSAVIYKPNIGYIVLAKRNADSTLRILVVSSLDDAWSISDTAITFVAASGTPCSLEEEFLYNSEVISANAELAGSVLQTANYYVRLVNDKIYISISAGVNEVEITRDSTHDLEF